MGDRREKITDYSAAEIEAAIGLAIQDGNTEAVESLMLALAMVDANRASLMLKTIEVGLAIRGEARG